MLHRPCLKSQYRLELLDSETLFLIHETGHRLLKGRLYALVMPLLDGVKTTDDIVEALKDQVPEAQIYYVLMLLEKKGLITEYAPGQVGDHAFWQGLDACPVEVRNTLSKTDLTIYNETDISTTALEEGLKSLGFHINASGSLAIVIVNDYLEGSLREINAGFLENKTPWILMKPKGATPWIGPFFSEETGCWECLAHRIRTHRPIELYIQQKLGLPSPPSASYASLPTTISAFMHLAATEIAKAIVSDNGILKNHILAYDSLVPNLTSHLFVRRPQCATCGTPQRFALTMKEPVVLQSTPEPYRDNSFRNATPESTWASHSINIDPITGILAGLKPIENEGSSFIFNFDAGPNLAVKNHTLDLLEGHFRDVSLGKGRTEIQGKVSGLCEAIERYSGVWQGYEPTITGTFEELGQDAIHPNQCMLYSEKQYHNNSGAQSYSHFFQTPEPFDPTVPISWTPLWSLCDERHKYLPTQYCYYSYVSDLEPRYCIADSNGCASGNTREEAMLQALLELIERDAVAIWWYNRLSRPGVDLSSIRDSWLQSLVEEHRKMGRELWALDLTHDLQTPVYAAFSRMTHGPENIVMGFGAHLTPKEALLRALTEVNQMLPGAQMDDKGQYRDKNKAACYWFSKATLANQPHLKGNPLSSIQEPPRRLLGNTGDDLAALIDILKRKNIDVLALDQTRPDIGMPVFRMVAPGLRPFWQRLAKGRLYDIPYELGWLTEKNREEQLNPIPIFI